MTRINAIDIKCGDRIIVHTGSGPVDRTVDKVIKNTQFGWVGFEFSELRATPWALNWYGWFEPKQEMALV